MDAIHRRIARNIRQLAKARKIMITYLPDHAAVGRTSFWLVMGGKVSPTVRWLSKVADALDVDPVELLAKPRGR